MTILRIPTENYRLELLGELETDPNRIDLYRSDEPFKLDNSRCLNTPIQVDPVAPTLTVPTGAGKRERPLDDADNAIRVYQYLNGLTPVQAIDRRLWTALSHTTFWAYTRARWPVIPTEPNKARSYIKSHWFIGTRGKGSLLRHSISRLWWAAHLTYAPWERDPSLSSLAKKDRAHFTRALFQNQQVFVDLLERNLGSDLKLRICFIEALERARGSVTSFDKLAKSASRALNLSLANQSLDALPVAQITSLCDDLVDGCANALKP